MTSHAAFALAGACAAAAAPASAAAAPWINARTADERRNCHGTKRTIATVCYGSIIMPPDGPNFPFSSISNKRARRGEIKRVVAQPVQSEPPMVELDNDDDEGDSYFLRGPFDTAVEDDDEEDKLFGLDFIEVEDVHEEVHTVADNLVVELDNDDNEGDSNFLRGSFDTVVEDDDDEDELFGLDFIEAEDVHEELHTVADNMVVELDDDDDEGDFYFLQGDDVAQAVRQADPPMSNILLSDDNVEYVDFEAAAEPLEEDIIEEDIRQPRFSKELESTLDGKYWASTQGRTSRRRKQTVFFSPC